MLWIFTSKSHSPPLASTVPFTQNTSTPFSYFVCLLHLGFCSKSLLKNYAWRGACERPMLEEVKNYAWRGACLFENLRLKRRLSLNCYLKKSLLETIVWRRACWRIMLEKGAYWRLVPEKEITKLLLNHSSLHKDKYNFLPRFSLSLTQKYHT